MKRKMRFTLGFLVLAWIWSIGQQAYAQVQHNWIRTNPGGGGAFSTAGITANGTLVALSDLSGVYVSKDEGETWTVHGSAHGLTVTHASAFAADPNDGNTFWIGTEVGIFHTTDAGQHFTHILEDGYIEDIHICPANHQRIYVLYHPYYDSWGTVYRSDDGGNTWMEVNQNLPSDLRLLKIRSAPNDDDVVYVMSGQGRFACSEASLFKSTDGGKTWTEIATSLPQIMDFAIHPNNPNTLYVTTMHADCDSPYYYADDYFDGAFYRSTNGGNTFSKTGDQTGNIFINPDNPQQIRLIDLRFPYPWNPDVGVWRSNNGGTAWFREADMSNWVPGWNDDPIHARGASFNGFTKTLFAKEDNWNKIIWAESQQIHYTTDGGNHFRVISTKKVGPDRWISTGCDNIVGHVIATTPADPNVIYMGGYDLGLWVSEDGGQSWERRMPEGTEFTWEEEQGSNTTVLLADPDRSGVVWASFQYSLDDQAAIFKSTDRGKTWTNVSTGLPDPIVLNSLVLDPNSPTTNRTLYVVADGAIYRSTNDGHSWEEFYYTWGLETVAVDPFTEGELYAGGEGGLLRYSQNQWEEITDDDMYTGSEALTFLDYGWEGVFNIVPDPNTPGRIYVVVYGEGKGLYRSDDWGDTWTKILTNDYMRDVLVVPDHPEILYATSSSAYLAGGYDPASFGIMVSTDTGHTWQDASQGMAWPLAGDMAINHVDPLQLWVWTLGPGVQYATIPFITTQTEQATAQNTKLLLHYRLTEYTLIIDTDPSLQGGQYKLIDIYGNAVRTGTLQSPKTTIETHTLPTGMYYLWVTKDDKAAVRSVAIMH